jgi:hypothetical protein
LVAFEELKEFGVLAGTYVLNLMPSRGTGQFSFAVVVTSKVALGRLSHPAVGQTFVAVVKLR